MPACAGMTMFCRSGFKLLPLAISPGFAGIAAPEQPGDIASRRIGFVAPAVGRGLLVDAVALEVAGDCSDVGVADGFSFGELFGATDTDVGPAAPELFAQFKAAARCLGDIDRRLALSGHCQCAFFSASGL